jgi:predicted phage-related endonuclease
MTTQARLMVPKPDDRDEWLAVRRPYFNASYAAVLFGRHPYVTPGDLATIKLTGQEQGQTRAMDRGRRLEDVIAVWWAETEGLCKVYEPGELFIAGRVMATVDRLVDATEIKAVSWVFNDMPVEIKSINKLAPEPEDYWIDQCQAIMLCVGEPALALVWFDSTMELRYRRIEADTKHQAAILDGAERFMAAIDLKMVPDWIELSYRNLSALHPRAKLPRVDLDDDGMNWVAALAEIRRKRLACEREEERIKAKVAEILGDNERGFFDGMEVVRWINNKDSRTLDAKRMAEEHPDIAKEYITTKPGARRMMPVGFDPPFDDEGEAA